MKKLAIFILLAAVLFSFVSCEKSDDVYYYGYFGNTALLLLYSSENSSLYEINIPIEQLVLWCRAKGIDNMSVAMRSYVGLPENGFMGGDPQVLAALRDILAALSGSASRDSESMLQVLVDRPELLSNARLMENMNRLCGTDFTAMAKALKDKSLNVRFYDAGAFLDNDDVIYSQNYFSRWLSQVLKKEMI